MVEAGEQLGAGAELLGEINRHPEMDYPWRHIKGVDGRIYGINERKPQASG